MSEPQWIGWLDLETTGTDETADEILEVGVIFTDLGLVEEVSTFHAVVKPTALHLSNTVEEMHAKSGLLGLLAAGEEIEDVDADLTTHIRHRYGSNHVILAGSGVSHFDRRFLKRWMPRSEKRFTYWSLDVGVMRRAMQYAGFELDENPNVGKPHRAIDDARLHLNEYRQWKRYLHELAGKAGQ